MTATPSTSPAGAVFLSYAREDTSAVLRLADALRAAGIEVWFDQNELVGGDAWDRKIRAQIKECALFLPVVSASTNARAEGYFRLEWLLAVERSRLMADDKAFLVPVVIDATTESAAKVPDKFRDVQWTKLPGGETSPAFVARVQKLLGGTSAAHPVTTPAAHSPTASAPAAKSGLPPWTWPAVAVLAIGVAAFFLARKSEPPVAPTKPVAESKSAAPSPITLNPSPGLAPLAPDKSVAVLPFENLSPDKDNAFFADGVHEDVIASLTKIRDLKVIGRTSVLQYRDPATRNHKKIAADLGVATLLEGSVRRAGTKVRVVAQLINARTDESLWAETYDRDLTDVFAIQSTLATEIAAALKANLTAGERALVADRPTQNQEAYDLYLRARTIFQTGTSTRESMDKIVALCEQAVAMDPAFAAAYAQLVYLNGRMYWFAHFDPTPARRERAKEALDVAVRLAPDKPETHRARGAYAYYCENDWTRAREEYRAAAAMLPNDAQLTYFIGLTYRRLGEYENAAVYFARAMELNPRDEVAFSSQLETQFFLHHYTEVCELAVRHARELTGGSANSLLPARARFELSHDAVAYLHEWEVLVMDTSSDIPETRYYWALAKDDLAAAEQWLTHSNLTSLTEPNGVINDPIALHRALVAFLRGQREASRRFAEEALAYYRAQTWTPRQSGVVMISSALAHAFAGHDTEALKLAQDGYAWQFAHDRSTAIGAQQRMAWIYLVLGRREDAFAVLRQLVTGPMHKIGPEGQRFDPFWRRVKDDPRFEEILKLAKPL